MERWKSNLYVLWVTQVLSLLSFGLFAPYIPIYLRELNITDPDMVSVWTGVMSFAPSSAMVIAAPIWGILSDRYGKKMMLLRATACATIIITAMAFVTNVWQLLILRACQGFFTGTVTASMTFVSANTPEDRMSYALGILSSSGFIGYSVGPVVGGLFVETLGMRPCFLIGGASMGIGLLMIIFLLKELVPPPPRIKGEKKKEKIPKEERNYKQLFTVAITLILVMLFTTRMMRSMLGPYMTLFVEEILGSTAGAAKWTGIINGAVCIVSAIATLTIVRLGDKFSKVKLVVLLTAICLPFAMGSALARSLILFLVIYSIYSFSSGALEPLLTSSASEKADPKVRGTLFGLVGMVNNAGFMVAPILGSFVSVQFSVQGILFLLPAFTALQLLIGFFALKLEKKKEIFPK